MKKKLAFILVLILTGLSYPIFAQELRTSLFRNILTGTEEVIAANPVLKKASSNFPFIDYFLYDGNPSVNLWVNLGTTVLNRQVIFNAVQASGIPYFDLSEPADVLNSKVIDLSGLVQPVFISFTANSGTTFTSGDSLVFEVKDIFGTWQTLWRSNGALLINREVEFTLNTAQFISPTFEMRWKVYTAQLNIANDNIFLLSKVVLSQTIPFPFYENISQIVVKDSTTLPYFFSSPDVKALDSSFSFFKSGHTLKLDVLNALNRVYTNGTATYGGADTLYLNPFDVSKFAASDSIIFSFAVMGINGLKPEDSLLVDFKNNLGNWVHTYSFGGSVSPFFSSYNLNVNRGRNRHANLQVRFIYKTTYSVSNTAAWLITGFRFNRKIELPFLDDFSASRKIVDPLRWADKFVYVNNEFPVNHPSINVATFDGLDARGNPYSPFPLKATSDMLTSHPFNLQGLSKSDSVILSFYYQYEPQGTTNQVYPDDSLILELRSSRYDKDAFQRVWAVNAKDTFFNTFQRYDFVIVDPQFFHDDLQFRFKNHGSLSGNLSQWHLDYVRFDKGRKINDAYYDVAITNTPPVMLGKYSSMPWYQYKANPVLYGNSSDSLRIANHDASAHLLNYYRSIIKPEGDTLARFVNVLGNLPAQSFKTLTVGQAFNFSTGLNDDSLVFGNKYKVSLGAVATDNITTNDTFTVPVVFSNYYAYDDGSAEGGYGVQLKTNVGVSLRFSIDVPDSVYGMYVFFNQSEKNVSTQRFNLKVWERISPLFEQATNDKVIYSQEVAKPVYTNTLNGFAAFRFTQPVAVKDSFFIGWDQVSSYVLNVGLDKNYPLGVNPAMAYKMDGRWYPTEIPGALMMRPIMGKFLELPAGLDQPETRADVSLQVYPNPANSYIIIEAQQPWQYTAALYDVTGREITGIINTAGRINLPSLPEGLYILNLEHIVNKTRVVKKLLINQNN